MVITGYERKVLLAQMFLPALYPLARKEIRQLVAAGPHHPRILDVGGRKSPYSVGLRGEIIVSDLPRKTALQESLNLGINSTTESHLRTRRSNIANVVTDDMTHSRFDDDEFDLVVAVEVLEHVEPDNLFLSEVRRVLKPGGAFFMTTPNGDAVPNTNPDHHRHYTLGGLERLLSRHFESVKVRYAVPRGLLHSWSIKPWRRQRPVYTSAVLVCALLQNVRVRSVRLREPRTRAVHLFAWAKVPG